MVENISLDLKDDLKNLKFHKKLIILNELYPHNAWVGKNCHLYLEEFFDCFRYGGRIFFKTNDSYALFLMIFGKSLKDHIKYYRYKDPAYRETVLKTIKELRCSRSSTG